MELTGVMIDSVGGAVGMLEGEVQDTVNAIGNKNSQRTRSIGASLLDWIRSLATDNRSHCCRQGGTRLPCPVRPLAGVRGGSYDDPQVVCRGCQPTVVAKRRQTDFMSNIL